MARLARFGLQRHAACTPKGWEGTCGRGGEGQRDLIRAWAFAYFGQLSILRAVGIHSCSSLCRYIHHVKFGFTLLRKAKGGGVTYVSTRWGLC